MGSFTGEVSCKRVTQEYKGILCSDGNRASRVTAHGCLTVRLTSRAVTKVGRSDLRIGMWMPPNLTDKSYPRDNRLISPERP